MSVETLPKLSVEALTQDVEEGKTFVLRVTTSQAPSASLPIAVESDLPSRFFIPRAEIRAVKQVRKCKFRQRKIMSRT